MGTCPQCGEEINKDYGFCRKCWLGSPLSTPPPSIFQRWKNHRLLVYGLGLFCVLAVISSLVPSCDKKPRPFTASPDVTSAVEGNTAFAVDLYQKLKNQPGNLFFSPYSISTALAMTYAGAHGETESEMARTLHFTLPQKDVPAAFGQLVARMEKLQRRNRITLTSANSLWCQQDYHFTDAFLQVVRKDYRAEAQSVDFARAASTADKINSWVEAKTAHRIKGIVDPGSLTPLTTLALCNAVYFKGVWVNRFDPAETRPEPFMVSTNQTVSVPMMHQKGDFRLLHAYGEMLGMGMTMLEMPYHGHDLSMVVLLPEAAELSLDETGAVAPPRAGDPLPELETKLTAANLQAWLAQLDQVQPHEMHVSFPRFTTTQSFNLADTLKSAGMATAFQHRVADFSGMDGTRDLFISDVLHKAFVEVNEAGTEAAAATVVHMMRASIDSFVADHPFIFLIRENATGSILFLGRIVDPTAGGAQ